MDLRQLFATTFVGYGTAAGISQEQLAHDAGIDRAYVSRVERAATYVGLEIIGKLSAVLGVEPAEFFQRPPKRPAKRKPD